MTGKLDGAPDDATLGSVLQTLGSVPGKPDDTPADKALGATLGFPDNTPDGESLMVTLGTWDIVPNGKLLETVIGAPAGASDHNGTIVNCGYGCPIRHNLDTPIGNLGYLIAKR